MQIINTKTGVSEVGKFVKEWGDNTTRNKVNKNRGSVIQLY